MEIKANTIITKEMIYDLKVGDILQNCFGRPSPITRIIAKGVSMASGKAYACFYQAYGNNAEISNDIHEDKELLIINF